MRVPSDGTEGTPSRSQSAMPTSSASSTGNLSSIDAMARASGAEKARRRPQVGVLEALLALLVLVLALTRGRPAATLLRQVPQILLACFTSVKGSLKLRVAAACCEAIQEFALCLQLAVSAGAPLPPPLCCLCPAQHWLHLLQSPTIHKQVGFATDCLHEKAVAVSTRSVLSSCTPTCGGALAAGRSTSREAGGPPLPAMRPPTTTMRPRWTTARSARRWPRTCALCATVWARRCAGRSRRRCGQTAPRGCNLDPCALVSRAASCNIGTLGALERPGKLPPQRGNTRGAYLDLAYMC